MAKKHGADILQMVDTPVRGEATNIVMIEEAWDKTMFNSKLEEDAAWARTAQHTKIEQANEMRSITHGTVFSNPPPDDMIPTKEQEEMIKEVFKNNPGVYEDGLAVTPEAKVAFLSELIKKPDITITPQDIVQTKVDISSSAPRTANNYSRRNLAVLKNKIEDVLKPSTYLDNINIEDRGVFKCRPDKPIKN